MPGSYTLKPRANAAGTHALTTAGTFYSDGTYDGTTSSTGGGTMTDISAIHSWLTVVLDVTNADTDADDTLDVYIDSYISGKWINLVHFPQIVGTTAAITYAATLTDQYATAALVTVTADPSANTVRALGPGTKIRARWVIVDSNGAGGAGDGDVSFSFGIYASGL